MKYEMGIITQIDSNTYHLACDKCRKEWEQTNEELKAALDEATILWGADPLSGIKWYLFCDKCWMDEIKRIWPSSRAVN